ncbi:HAMP domain-containing sensor histidine kinase [Achromobacter seleniivolatilans]|uniref:histidine kinase n=1 Tax=Achromobacter seleniivolatilans TaxID=3047478 RepID=A0ABY9M7K3_9BURK|nr:HAMP domain-containing sensor histidine kinase [Achromobacter sp. R39]WMD23002.1 HAMP domain-containing sensor histidine kinase [Achromobacter sp. R39]
MQAPLRRLGLLLCALLWPGAVLAFGLSGAHDDLQLGVTAGIAIACGLACAVAWGYTRQALYGAGVAFMLVEGLFRSMPSLLPPGALQAGSFAALLALTAPILSGSPASVRLAAACRWASIALAGVAALALIFVYETENGLIPAWVAGVCAILSAPLAAWFLGQAVSRPAGRVPALALAAAYALSAWMLGRDAWLANGADSPGALVELARLLLVTGALLSLALSRQRSSQPAILRNVQEQSDAEHVAQGELRLAELAGALDTQRQMNALVSHELRAPLATISAAAQSLDMILSDSGETVDNRLARIHRSVNRMTELMDQLLNQDRLGEQAWTPRGEQMDMAELARDVVTAMKPDTAHALVLQTDGALPVFCDRPLTSVVLRNLIHNAIKYSPANEPVRIETGQTLSDGMAMSWMAVVDRGPGIGEEEQSQIFEPHFRRAAHRETQGMGIGLYLARRICQNQGGSLTMHSKVGVGTRFVITLPARGPAT